MADMHTATWPYANWPKTLLRIGFGVIWLIDAALDRRSWPPPALPSAQWDATDRRASRARPRARRSVSPPPSWPGRPSAPSPTGRLPPPRWAPSSWRCCCWPQRSQHTGRWTGGGWPPGRRTGPKPSRTGLAGGNARAQVLPLGSSVSSTTMPRHPGSRSRTGGHGHDRQPRVPVAPTPGTRAAAVSRIYPWSTELGPAHLGTPAPTPYWYTQDDDNRQPAKRAGGLPSKEVRHGRHAPQQPTATLL